MFHFQADHCTLGSLVVKTYVMRKHVGVGETHRVLNVCIKHNFLEVKVIRP